jgi:Glycosyltransferases, probably involved in cell wall biogenesis
MEYTVVVPTKDDGDVFDAIRAAASQDFESFEVVVVDASKEEHAKRVQRAADETGAEYLREDDFGNSWGLNAARNIGVEVSDGEKIVLLDGDCVPPENWLDALDESFSAGADIVDTRIAYVSEGPKCPLDRVVQNLDGEHRYLGATLAFRRVVWQEVGGFDEDFKHIRGDSDFGIKAEEAGFEHGFVDEVTVEHMPEDFTPIEFVKNRSTKFVEEPRFFQRHRGSEFLETPAAGAVLYPKRAAFISALAASVFLAVLEPALGTVTVALSLVSAAMYWRREAAKREGGLDPCLKQTALLPVLVPLAMLGKRLAIWRGALRDRVFVL